MTTFTDYTGVVSAAWLNTVAAVIEAAAVSSIAVLTPAADKLPYYTAASTAALTTLSAYARTVLDDTDAASMRTTLGLGTAATHAHGDYATAAQGALADTALQADNGVATGTYTLNSTDISVRSDHMIGVGVGTGTAPNNPTANVRYVSLMGLGVTASDAYAVLQFRSNAAAEGALNLGGLEWSDEFNTSGVKRSGYLAMTLTGTTVNNRGSSMVAAYHADAGSGTTQGWLLDHNGNFSVASHATLTSLTPRLLVSKGSTALAASAYPTATHVAYFQGADSGQAIISVNGFTSNAQLTLTRANTSAAAPSQVLSGENIGIVSVRGYHSGGAMSGARAQFVWAATENWTGTANGCKLIYYTVPSTTVTNTQAFTVENTGQLNISQQALTTVSSTAPLLTVSKNAASLQAPVTSVAHFADVASTATTVLVDSYAAANSIMFRRANTSASAPSAIANADVLGSIGARGYQTTTGAYSTADQAVMEMRATEAWTSTAQGTEIAFKTTANTTTTVTEQLKIANDGKLTITSLITSYNGVATVGNGVGAIVARSDLTSQSAAITATTLYAVPASGAGLYRVSFNASITTAATTSCELGGPANTAGFRLIHTSPTDSVVKTDAAIQRNNSTSTTNATGTTVSGVFTAYCKASTNLQYTYGYTSVGATAMVYELHIIVEYLG